MLFTQPPRHLWCYELCTASIHFRVIKTQTIATSYKLHLANTCNKDIPSFDFKCFICLSQLNIGISGKVFQKSKLHQGLCRTPRRAKRRTPSGMFGPPGLQPNNNYQWTSNFLCSSFWWWRCELLDPHHLWKEDPSGSFPQFIWWASRRTLTLDEEDADTTGS